MSTTKTPPAKAPSVNPIDDDVLFEEPDQDESGKTAGEQSAVGGSEQEPRQGHGHPSEADEHNSSTRFAD
ncbi:hypothetical protein [Limnoglobus roseus]|uniref:hypothetical protein n=1 Tax=Limnoglobus roseus TaxID=2598579 RepID=UPI0011EB4D11|nr:hypothetical protein [Limnoglobus roseus]